MKRAARPGQKLTDFYTASFYNEVVKTHRPPTGLLNTRQENNPVKVKAYGPALTLDRFRIVGITGPALVVDDNDDLDPAFDSIVCAVNDTPTDENFGVLQGPLNDTNNPDLVLQGLTWAHWTHTNGDTHVEVVSGDLVSSSSGPALIITPPQTSPGVGLILLAGRGSGGSKFYVLLEDMPSGHGSSARAQIYDWAQGELGRIDLHNWGKASVAGGGFLDGVRAGYYGTAIKIEGKWAHNVGPCLDDFICATAGTLSGTPPDGQVNSVYAYAMTASGTNTDVAATGLPPGLTTNTSGNITGTPTTAGTYEVTFTATADKTGAEGTCTITIIRSITIDPEP